MNIKITIDRFENDKAVFKTEEGISIIWPKNNLPEQAREGMVLNFNITDNLQAEKEKKQLAKDILNEILNTD
ncbi:DUF3006 domain-containing protein [Patescibacteria group bacterium]|nr:DUF3006 domain-containing protein [Candidatus Falkowbacteria bacterium]MBU3905718.1 DUF3006 domain-containing protein [Patescibacteria group bacterium]MBU4014957.1 DUF3006 domain-containing protein [Patescibacteria group bacterium]MBU4026492.1 DUF3006 domain-containing protein [Patescibacteria group bacterium]MBU4072699.1 DUF3006 domain-containing protein [Patescibacteria group bacterium]